MKIEKLSSYSIKIHLKDKELEKCGLSAESIEENTDDAQLFLAQVIALASNECDFFANAEKFSVEVYKTSDGCIIYISVYNRPKNTKRQFSVLCCKIENSANLFDISKKLYLKKALVCSSSLYIKDSNYFLIIKIYEKALNDLMTLLSEFCQVYQIDSVQQAFICERYTEISKEYALEKLSEMLKT